MNDASTPIGRPDRPALRPGVSVIPMSDGVQLRAGDEDIHVLRVDSPRWAVALLKAIDGTRDRDALVELADGDAAWIDDLLTQLNDAGLLTNGQSKHHDPIAVHLSQYMTDPQQAVDALRRATVAVVGHPSCVAPARRLIDEHAMQSFSVPLQGRGDGDGDGDVPIITCDLVLCAWSAPDLDLVERVNAAAIAQRQPCLFVDLSHGRHATVGPIFVPGEGACHACFRARLHENTAAYDELIAVEQAMRASRDALPGVPPLPAHVSHALGVAVAELVAFIVEHRPMRTLNQAITIDFDQGRSWTEPVWRVPWCPACGDGTGDTL